MLSINDIKKLTEVFATKQEMLEMEERLVSKTEFRKMMTTVDAVFGEVKAMREEQASHYQSHEDNDMEHKEFKRRFGKLESTTLVAHQIKIKNK